MKTSQIAAIPRRSSEAREEQWPEIDPAAMPLDTLGARLAVKKACGNTYSALCPAHADTKPSLSITETDKGDLLVYCHAGCPTTKVMAAIGLKMCHLFASDFARGFNTDWVTRRLGYGPGGFPPSVAMAEPLIDCHLFKSILSRARCPPESLAPLAHQLGLPVSALEAIGVGSLAGRWVFAECNHEQEPVAVLYRSADGGKFCERGSERGLTIPSAGLAGSVLHIAEGATDTAALLSVGLATVGRPAAHASGAVRGWLARFVAAMSPAQIIVVGDRDETVNGRNAGADGAAELADLLSKESGRPTWWALPANGFKDVRDQITKGQWGLGLVLESAT
jgi:hypothetical protein